MEAKRQDIGMDIDENKKDTQNKTNTQDKTDTSNKKDKSIIYWNMNYKGKFRRTLWMIPFVIILCILLPLSQTACSVVK